MRAEELRKKSDSELEELLKNLYKKLSDLKVNYSLNKIKNNQEMKLIKKDVARILTILHQRKLKKNI